MITSLIKLSEIPEEGLAFSWNRKSGEATKSLVDLIGNSDFQAEFFIRPLNHHDYTLNGTIKTQLAEVCSRCGNDFLFSVNSRFNEILIPRQSQDRTGKYSKVNHISEKELDGPEVSEYENNLFDMGEYLHEVVALAAPFNPIAPVDSEGNHEKCNNIEKDQLFIYDEIMPTEDKKNPFAALKNLKLN